MNFQLIISILLSNTIAVHSSALAEPQYCQWETTFVDTYQRCAKKCSASKGFIHPTHRRFICTEEVKSGKPKISDPNEEGLYSCECVHPIFREINCDPKNVYENRTKEQCDEMCRNYLVLNFIQNNKIEAYCGLASDIPLYNLEAVIVAGLKENKQTGHFYRKSICKCGLNLNAKVEKKIALENRVKKKERKYPRSLDELLYTCEIGDFPLTRTESCEGKCLAANAFFDDSGNKLICYHDRTPAEMLSTHGESCQCGVIINRSHKNLKRFHLCHPNGTYPWITDAVQCQNFCQTDITVYVFNTVPRRTISYCDSGEQAPGAFKGLQYRIGRWKKFVTSQNKTRVEFPCACGLHLLPGPRKKVTIENSSLPSNGISMQTSNGRTSSFIQSAMNQESTRNSKLNTISLGATTNIRNIQNSNIVAAECQHEEINTITGSKSFGIPVSNQNGITNIPPQSTIIQPNMPISSLAAANSKNKLISNYVFETTTNQQSTPNSNWSASSFGVVLNNGTTARNSNNVGGSSSSNYRCQYNTEDDDIFGKILKNDSFVSLLNLPSHVPETKSQSFSNLSIANNISPWQFGQLQQLPSQQNPNIDQISWSAKKSILHEPNNSTNENTNKEDDIFGEIMKDISSNFPYPVNRPREEVTFNFAPVGDFTYPSQFEDYLANIDFIL